MLNSPSDEYSVYPVDRARCSHYSVAAVIRNREGRLLLQHRDDKPGVSYPGKWSFFGGYVEEGETPSTALQRELREEISWHANHVVHLTTSIFDQYRRRNAVAYREYFLVEYDNRAHPPLLQREGQGMAWVGREELPSYILDAVPIDLPVLVSMLTPQATFLTDRR